MPKKVFVALSGGLDSAVAAYLLKKEGYDVTGVSLKIPGLQAEEAVRVAKELEIPYQLWDPGELFEEKVINYFCCEYLEGRTPNPCVVCNYQIKFGFLLEKALSSGADFLATGHYARVDYDKEKSRWLLKKGLDNKRDQSYFLFLLRQEQLSHLLFPLGSKTKEEVRRIARKIRLHVADVKESREICFVPDDDYHSFLQQRNPEAFRPGPIVDLQGKKLGTHNGLAFYTIGQRRGLGLSLGIPFYVIEIDYRHNTLVVGEKKYVSARGLNAGEVNLISWDIIPEQFPALVKIRYTTPAIPAMIFRKSCKEVEVIFASPQKAVTPGQAVVFYENDLVLGGGFINNALI